MDCFHYDDILFVSSWVYMLKWQIDKVFYLKGLLVGFFKVTENFLA